MFKIRVGPRASLSNARAACATGERCTSIYRANCSLMDLKDFSNSRKPMFLSCRAGQEDTGMPGVAQAFQFRYPLVLPDLSMLALPSRSASGTLPERGCPQPQRVPKGLGLGIIRQRGVVRDAAAGDSRAPAAKPKCAPARASGSGCLDRRAGRVNVPVD